MVTHVHRDDLLVLNQQLQRDAVRQVDGHRLQAIELAAQGMQTQRGVRGAGLQQLECLEVGAAGDLREPNMKICAKSGYSRRSKSMSSYQIRSKS